MVSSNFLVVQDENENPSLLKYGWMAIIITEQEKKRL